MTRRKPAYGAFFDEMVDPIEIEMECLRKGGSWKNRLGVVCGKGTEFHFCHMIELIWPWITWHKWLKLFVENYLTHRSMVVFGAAATGKTFDGALCALADYFPWPSQTTVIVCSTSKERLEDRIWGEVKRLHKDALLRHEWLPGHLIEGRQRIVTNPYVDSQSGRDFRNGLVGVPVKRGNDYVGLSEFTGAHNKRVRLFGDEIHLLPKVFVDGLSNLDKAADFKVVGLANPKETTDAAGILGEPSAEFGFWDGGIDQSGGTKTWPTRRPNGVSLQFVGSDSPNLDGHLGIPLITQEAIDRDIAFFGRDSWQFTMMNEGRMPRGQGSRRVITRQECLKHRAMEPPIWLNSQQTHLAFLDAAYGGVGGDRCILTFLEFGQESVPLNPAEIPASTFVDQPMPQDKRRQIMALTESILVPVTSKVTESPCDQIVDFCMGECAKRNIPPENFGFDSGMRTALVQAFDRKWSNRVQSVDFGGPASRERKVSYDIDVACYDYYSKFVTELWFSVRMVIIADQFRGLTEDVMLEFAQREWGMVGANKIEVEPKKLMKARMGFSPDRANSLAGAVELARRKGFVIRRLGENRKELPGDEEWKHTLREQSRRFWRSGNLVEEIA